MNELYMYIIVAMIISFTPFFRSLFGTIHTLVHESGHAIAALLTSGKVYSISLFKTTDGVAFTASRSRFRSVIVSYAGYTFASVVSIGSFYLISTGEILLLFYLFFGLASINLILWVRNLYGIVWLFLYLTTCCLLIYFQLYIVKELIVYLIASVILVQSVLASLTIFKLSMINSNHAGDATGLQKLTYIPACIWGFLFLFQSIFSSYYVLRYLV